MNDTHEIRIGGFRWTCDSSLRAADLDRLFGPTGLRLDTVNATIIKDAPHRVVYRVVLDNLDLHVKHYKGDLRDWCRCLLQGRRAAREFRLSREVARRGVPTLEVLAYAEHAHRLGASDSFLVTRTLPDVRPLLDYLEYELPLLTGTRRARVQQRLAHAVGELLARQQQAGIRHDDLHPGNVLLRFDNDEPLLYLIDLDAVCLRPTLDWRTSRQNLIVLDRWFATRWNRSDRRRAWKAYCATRTDLALDERALARDVGRRTPLALLHHTRILDRRCLGGNRHYVRLRSRGVTGYAMRELDPSALQDLLANADGLIHSPEKKPLKHSASSTVVELALPVAGQLKAVICKRLPATLSRTLRSLVRTPPAVRSYLSGQAFRVRGLPTPRPLAVWHRRRFGLLQEGYLLVEKVAEARPLREFVEHLTTRPSPERIARQRAVIDDLARVLRKVHEYRFSHRDLKAANILISPASSVMSSRGLRDVPPNPDAPGDHVWLIDLVGVTQHRKLRRSRQVRDLARLQMSFLDHPDVTRTDRLRFLRTYLAWGLRGQVGWKSWWRDVDRAARTKVRTNVRRGRVVG